MVNEKLGFTLLMKAANLGDKPSQLEVIRFALDSARKQQNTDVVAKIDFAKLKLWLEDISSAGCLDSLILLAEIQIFYGPFENSEKEKINLGESFLKLASDSEDSMLRAQLCILSLRLFGARNRELRDCLTILKDAAEKSSPNAQFALGEIYEKGFTDNIHIATSMYFSAAKSGHLDSMEKLVELWTSNPEICKNIYLESK